MNFLALLTSAGINIGLCSLFLMLYSILRKQPGNVNVYFGRRIAEEASRRSNSFTFERFVPSPSWIVKALQCKEEEILSVSGLDAVVFLRLIVFSMRIFCIAAVACVFGILPLNYFGQETKHKSFSSESLEVFTISNVQEESSWFWVHCLALYIISISACVLLYVEYKSIARMRLVHIRQSPNPSHFTVLVRSIPKSPEESYSDSVRKFFQKYHSSSYLSHQMIYKTGKVQKIMTNAEKAYRKFMHLKNIAIDQKCISGIHRCCLCAASSDTFQLQCNDFELNSKKTDLDHSNSSKIEKECSAAFVFFKTRYAAVIISDVLQSSNPMVWVTDLAPEPHDVYWSNLWLPYRQLWIRRIATLLASIVFMFLFLIPVTFVQGLSQLDQLQQKLPFLRGILKKTFVSQIVTGYLPSVILQLFLYSIPPIMMLFSTLEGPISHSERKKSAAFKVLYFTIWNVFFVNVLSGSVISQLNVISSPKGIPTQLAKAVPRQATFFTTYVLTSGWASLSSEVMQLFPLIWNLLKRYIFQINSDQLSIPSFPYHTEVPKVLLMGLLGFTLAILAPLILPFLLVYFFLCYVVYRNQILNVYCSKYETGGRMWPIMHNTTIFSLVLSQIIALGVFGLKKSPVSAGFMIPLVILTLLFNEYCRQRFNPIFKSLSAMNLIEMDQEDEQCGRMEEIHQQLHTAYQQLPPDEIDFCSGECSGSHELHENEGSRTIQLDDDKDQTNDDNDCRKPLEKIVPVA
ncbi:CSC1-like protein RXW8 [Dioscorea cayenensis subsp. rotundata]|uniref:CSC1-like protein RXW8 n=1 Tax=Dioscorea cayennensis subsp. rotundata TaxID=55577 RepID=A0AB40CJ97_DIOCR|nr:CSC1-like protein RXW8 [Dioscorea cayenensis subsp. rotundata]